MKKIMGMAGSFLLGFAFFVAGGAVAIDLTSTDTTEIIVEDVTQEDIIQEVVVEDVPQEIVIEEVPQEVIVEEEIIVEEIIQDTAAIDALDPILNRPFCFEIGKNNELGGDCFCVHEWVDEIVEADCLLASGVTTESEYKSQVFHIETGTVNKS